TVAAPEAAAEKLTGAGATIAEGSVAVDGNLITMSVTEGMAAFITAVKASLGVEAEVVAEEAA
ncbi:MAG: hypothetical protein ACKVH0_14990, partial [Alphaproteobacteria bacterium]